LATSGREKNIYTTRKISNENNWRKLFLKFELKMFVLNFEKKIAIPPPEGNGKN
jgi:hypothetical protein